MKKILLAVLPIALIACQNNSNATKPKVSTEEVSITETKPDPTENMAIPTSYIPKLEAKKWDGIKEMTDETFKSDILASSTVTLVDFNATWCGPCRQQKPILDKLVKEYAGKVNFASVDVDVCPNTAQMYRISSIPTLAFMQNAKVGGSSIGLTPYNQLKAMIDKALQEAK